MKKKKGKNEEADETSICIGAHEKKEQKQPDKRIKAKMNSKENENVAIAQIKIVIVSENCETKRIPTEAATARATNSNILIGWHESSSTCLFP